MLTKESILSTIKSHKPTFYNLGIKDIGLFGSFVSGNPTNKSDIDILIDFEPEKENYDNYMAVCDLVEQLFTSRKIEIVTKNGLSPYIGPKILKEVVYA